MPKYRVIIFYTGLHGNECSQNNGGCSHLCIPIPTGRTCACPDNMTKNSRISYQCDKVPGGYKNKLPLD